MMEQILSNYVGKFGRLFLTNGFSYLGNIKAIDHNFISFFDAKTSKNYLFSVSYFESFKEESMQE